MAVNYKQIFAIKKKNETIIKNACPKINEQSGIYFLTREENGFKFAYIGQAVNLLERLASHLNGYQHIDLSLKKHKLWSSENTTGWKINFINCPKTKLDELEQYYIKEFANKGYQLRNKTSGSQGVGKQGIDDNRPTKGYRDGLKQGEKNALKQIREWFDKYLVATTKVDNRYAKNALEKFNDLLKGEEENEK